MSTGLAELVVQELEELLLPFSRRQMQSLPGNSSRSCKRQGRLCLLRYLHWLGQLVLSEALQVASVLEDKEALAVDHQFLDLIPFPLVQRGLGSCIILQRQQGSLTNTLA
uniref:DEAD-box ATP-dependent RNA helicase-like protein n=1 Tax=Rhizophora mucronata TaxID=61149 RepID=A0A2P2JKS5_RHIMU